MNLRIRLLFRNLHLYRGYLYCVLFFFALSNKMVLCIYSQGLPRKYKHFNELDKATIKSHRNDICSISHILFELCHEAFKVAHGFAYVTKGFEVKS